MGFGFSVLYRAKCTMIRIWLAECQSWLSQFKWTLFVRMWLRTWCLKILRLIAMQYGATTQFWFASMYLPRFSRSTCGSTACRFWCASCLQAIFEVKLWQMSKEYLDKVLKSYLSKPFFSPERNPSLNSTPIPKVIISLMTTPTYTMPNVTRLPIKFWYLPLKIFEPTQTTKASSLQGSPNPAEIK